MSPKFSCPTCGPYFGTFNFSPCPNFFNHEEIEKRRKESGIKSLLAVLHEIQLKKEGCFPTSQIQAFAEGERFSDEWSEAMLYHLLYCADCNATYLRLMEKIF